jgi:hypothetical protein
MKKGFVVRPGAMKHGKESLPCIFGVAHGKVFFFHICPPKPQIHCPSKKINEV